MWLNFWNLVKKTANKENKWEIKGIAAEKGAQEITAALESDLVKTFNIYILPTILKKAFVLKILDEIKKNSKTLHNNGIKRWKQSSNRKRPIQVY